MRGQAALEGKWAPSSPERDEGGGGSGCFSGEGFRCHPNKHLLSYRESSSRKTIRKFCAKLMESFNKKMFANRFQSQYYEVICLEQREINETLYGFPVPISSLIYGR